MANPKAHSQYQLNRKTTPRVYAEGGRVMVRLELASVADQTDRLDVELVLEVDSALLLGQELVWAAQKLGQ